jgi:predicted AlkP superfamily pyrophosphatase or phosphodiesterase
MQRPDGIARVIMVILDGLRADAIPLFPLPHLIRLARNSAYTLAGRTVQPSITASALTSLLTGVTPRVHGVESERVGVPRPRASLTPLPQLLARHGLGLRAFRSALPPLTRGVATRITERLGIQARFEGRRAEEVLTAATPALSAREPGVVVLHWLDADRAGHARGWGSPDYVRAARHLDDTLRQVVENERVLEDPATLLIAFADHGGGGAVARDHNSLHPLDVTIPILLAGGQVIPGVLRDGASLLDIPATLAWALGIPRPAQWSGRPLLEAFHRARPAADPACAEAALLFGRAA